jgi:hypothetical protein
MGELQAHEAKVEPIYRLKALFSPRIYRLTEEKVKSHMGGFTGS